MLVPAVGSIVWYGCIPVSGPFDPDKSDRARFVFLIHPFSMTFLAYLLVALFHTSVDPERPRQPVVHYLHILAVNWVVQVRRRARVRAKRCCCAGGGCGRVLPCSDGRGAVLQLQRGSQCAAPGRAGTACAVLFAGLHALESSAVALPPDAAPCRR